MSPSAGAGFPVVVGRATGASGAVTTVTHPITLPAHASGDTLLVVWSLGAGTDKTVSIDTGASSAGWTTLIDQKNSITATAVVLTLVAGGSGETLTLTTSAADASSHISLALQNVSAITLSAANVTGTNHNPPNHTPAGGTDDYLWLATRSAFGTSNATVAPASFDDLVGVASGNASGATTDVAEQELNASSNNPGAFTNANTVGVVCTIAIQPV